MVQEIADYGPSCSKSPLGSWVDVHFVTVLFFVVGGLWQLSHVD